MNTFQENSRTWYLIAHREAATTEDLSLARALYEQRIKELEERLKEVESNE